MANSIIAEIGQIDDYDNVVSTFKFASGNIFVHCSRQNEEINAISGTIGVVDISRFASYGYDQRLEVLGPGGMLQVENENPNSSVHYTAEGISK